MFHCDKRLLRSRTNQTMKFILDASVECSAITQFVDLAPSSKSKESPKHFALQRLTGHIAMVTLRLLAATDAWWNLALTVSPDMRDEFWHILRMWSVFATGCHCHRPILLWRLPVAPTLLNWGQITGSQYCSSGNCQETALQAAVAMTCMTFQGLEGHSSLLDPAGFLWSKLAPPCLHLQLCAACTDWASQITSLVP